MNTVEPWNVPRSEAVATSAKTVFIGGNSYIQDVFDGLGDSRGGEVPPFPPSPPNATCPDCGQEVIHTHYLGFIITLEPAELTDADEARAIAANSQTFNLWPIKRPRPRYLSAILHRNVAPRHAQHACGQTFGSQPRQPSSRDSRPPITDEPPYPF